MFFNLLDTKYSDDTIEQKIENVFKNKIHTSFLEENCIDLWKETCFEGYSLLNNKQKGKYGENIVTDIMRILGYNVKHSINTGHDRIIENIKTEIKFSLSQTNQKKGIILDNVFVMNHVAVSKDWERLIFVGINFKTDHKMFWFSKDVFEKHLVKNYFSAQQGGKKGGNDDFICSSQKLIELSNSSYVRKLNEW